MVMSMSIVTVLIAEDNADDYLMLEYAFEKANFRAKRIRARDGVEARAYLAGEGRFGDRELNPFPSLILADLKMPRMNGLELLRWTRAQPVIRRIPFIVLSASANSRDVTNAYEACVNSYHVKPSRLEDLILLIQQLAEYWFEASARPEISEDLGGPKVIEEAKARVEVKEPLPDVLGQEKMLLHVISNLVSNGVKFVATGVQPEVKISAETQDSRVRLSVSDNGIGIAPEYHGRIFKVFERLHDSESYPGTGVGLAVVQKGIEKMGGKFGVDSEPGKGSSFWIELLRAHEDVNR